MHAFFSKETWFINYFIYLVRLQNASEVREGEGCTWKRSKDVKRHCKVDEARRKEWCRNCE